MNHTTTKALLAVMAILPASMAGQQKQTPEGPAKKSEPTPVQLLMKKLLAKEKTVKSVTMRLTTTDQLPNGMRFSTVAKLRVLGTTHYQTSVNAVFQERLRDLSETVVTPKGCWTHQSSEFENVYLRMSAELVAELRKKAAVLGAKGRAGFALPAVAGGKAGTPLGSAILNAIDSDFALQVKGKQKLDKVPCVLLEGKRKDSQSPVQTARIRVLLREADAIPVRMVEFDEEGKELMRMEVDEIVLNPKLAESSFKIETPKGVEFMDIRRHAPSWAQILRLREDYEAKVAEGDKKK